MQGPEPLPPSERSAATGAWQAPASGSGKGPGLGGNDPPTVRTGSSARRAWVGVGIGGGGKAYPEPGQRIESFELEEAIGVGGMGAVYRAHDIRLDRHVALKLLPPEQSGDPEVVQRFYQEGRAAAQLDHENIARVYTIGNDGNYHYISFEFIEGTTIRQRVERNGPLPVSEAINYTLQIAGALVHAAERGVVHRDIKPSNIIVTPQGRAKLVDMGLARRFERGGDDGLTQSGMTLGTFDYISPEQARDPRDVDVRSDLYSLGCTLFHMLTGRPPFPEGTVLQKLLQHQEEPPPDVCTLNPLVPPDLATILVKLMAKDRDRRYQTPEQLVRDLLTVAGTLGLRSISPEGLVWMSGSSPAAWERHLVWGLPALAFALVMAVLVGWGQEPGPPLPGVADVSEVLPRPAVQPLGPKADPGRRDGPGGGGDGDRASRDPGAPRGPAGETGAATGTPAPPRHISVDSSFDLLDVLASAPPHSVVELADDGPYFLGDPSSGRRPSQRLLDRDLTIKAEAGVMPTLRLAQESAVGKGPSALLDLVGGRVTLEGLEFVLDDDDGRGLDGPIAAVQAEDTELTLRRCRFRRQGDRSSRDRMVALRVHATAASNGDRPAAVTVDACHFDGGQVGVFARGPASLLLRDCTLGTSDPAIWLENGKAPGSASNANATAAGIAAELRLRHVSLIAGDGPAFRFEGISPRVWADDSAVAPGRDAEATLIAADDPEGLDWRGRGNLYGRIATYLQPTNARNGRDAVRDFARWAETPSSIRETGSTATQERIWNEPEAEQALTQEGLNPARAFRLAAGVGATGVVDAGARPRPGPLGPLLPPPVKLAANPAEGRRDRETRPTPAAAAESSTTNAPEASMPAPMPMDDPDTPPPMPMLDPDAEPSPMPMPRVRRPEMPEMPVMPPTAREAMTARGGPSARPTVDDDPPDDVPAAAPDAAPAIADPKVIRTAEQLADALNQDPTGEEGKPLRIAADADWVLTGLQVRALGRRKIKGEPGPTRPRFRFRPTPADFKAPTAWSVAIDLRSGSLHWEGIDFVLARDDAPPQGRWAAFGVGPGTELSLTRCTVTIEGEDVLSAAVVAQAIEVENANGDGKDGAAADLPAAPPAARVQFNDSLLRSGGDLVEVTAGGQLTLEMGNVVVATGGSLVHANGLPRGQSVSPVKLSLRQVSARMVGGLIQLESAPGEPELPLAEISARDSILACAAQGAPLLQVDGQDDLGTLQDRIRWDGLRVAYHQINAYRRDQTAQVGTVPKIYNRPDWTVAVGPQEEDPIHGDLKFLQKWTPDRPAWTFRRDDFRLAADSPAASSGADLAQIPAAR